MRDQPLARALRARPRAAYAVAVALTLVTTSAAAAVPAERNPGVMDVVVGGFIAYSVVAALAIHRVLGASAADAVAVRTALALTPAMWAITARFVTGSLPLTWGGFAATAVALAVVLAQAR